MSPALVLMACSRGPVTYVIPVDTNLIDTGSGASAPDSASAPDDSADSTDSGESGESGDTVDTGPCEPTTDYRDADGDGHGNRYDTAVGCEPPEGYVADDVSDCDDQHATAYYGAVERLTDGADNDCDGAPAATSIDDLPLWEVSGDVGSMRLGMSLATGDFDGNGVTDLALGGYEVPYGKEWRQSPAFVYSGPLVVDEASADATLFGSATDWASSVCNAGDLDGDGFGDLVIGATRGGPDGYGIAYVARGPLSGTVDLTLGAQSWTGSGSLDNFGICTGIGDLDGDGLEDLVLSAYGATTDAGPRAGAVYLLLGPAEQKTVADADQIITGTEQYEYVGYDVAALDDLDGDGRDDFGISALAGSSYLLTEYAPGVFAPADVGIAAHVDATSALLLSRAGDLDGDGYGEVGFATAYEAHDLWIVAGPFDGDPLDVIDAAEIVFSFGRAMAYATPLRDWNGEGQTAIAIGDPSYSTSSGFDHNNSGLIYLMAAPIESGTHSPEREADRIEDPYADGYLGQIMEGGSDLNGDGLSDLAFTMPDAYLDAGTGGRAFVLFGGDVP